MLQCTFNTATKYCFYSLKQNAHQKLNDYFDVVANHSQSNYIKFT